MRTAYQQYEDPLRYGLGATPVRSGREMTGAYLRRMKYALIVAALLYGFVPSACSQNSDTKALRKFRRAKRKSLDRERGGPLDRRATRELCYYPFDPAWTVEAEVQKLPGGDTVRFATSDGQVRSYREYAYLSFDYGGEAHRLTVYRMIRVAYLPAAYADQLFLPFYDATNGANTYGGGRYLDLRIGDLNGERYSLDFNRAYNPYCAYADGYSCPVPPVKNRLALAVEAGECNFAATSD